jgi:hypothetical protein
MRQFVKIVCMGLVLFFTCIAVCQQDAAPKQGGQAGTAKQDWREHWRNSTVAFGEIAHDQLLNRDYFHALGTGVAISTGLHTGYFVTARHMFCNPDQHFHPAQLRIRFAWQEHKSIYEYLGVPLDVRSISGADLWASLDDESDVAAIPISNAVYDALPPEDQLKTYDAISVEDATGDVYEGEQVLILGYPEIVGNEKLVRAIVRQGVVAWTNPNHPDEKTFLVDANLYPGNSGGPVIKLPFGLKKDGSLDFFTGGKLPLLGIVSQGPVQDIKTTVFNPRLGHVDAHTPVVGIGAIGFIEPGSKIRKLIEAMRQGTATAPVCDVPDPVQKQPGGAQK